MSVTLLRMVSPISDVSNGPGFLESFRAGNRIIFSLRAINRKSSFIDRGRLKMDQKFGSTNLASPAEEMTLSSEQNVYDVVSKQAAMFKNQTGSSGSLKVKPDNSFLPGSPGLLSEAYDRCGEICEEYAKTFYLGTLLMTPERRKAIWAIYVWCRRTDELVDGPNASHITPTALDRWEAKAGRYFPRAPF